MAATIGPHATLVEYGAGAALKTRILLNALESPKAYVPIDISADFLRDVAASVSADYPDMDVRTLVGNFLDPALDVPASGTGLFPGSTIGNLSDGEINAFLGGARRMRRFLLGVDLVKPESVLVPAYADAQGVTQAFNLNLLARANREAGATFDLTAFTHEARWNADASQMEMHLRSLTDQAVRVAGMDIAFAEGETIHTEISRKFTVGTITDLAARAGWTVETVWTDAKDWFAVVLLT